MYDNRHQKFPGKLHTRWLGPFKVTEVFSNGSLQLGRMQGKHRVIEKVACREKSSSAAERKEEEELHGSLFLIDGWLDR